MANRVRALELSGEDRKVVEGILMSQTAEVRRYRRALVLSLKACGKTDYAAALAANVSLATAARTAARYLAHGLEAALSDNPRSGRPLSVSEADSLWLTALACSKPADFGLGRETWYPVMFCGFVREVAEAEGHPRMATACDDTILGVLDRARLQPFRLRYYCTRKDAEFNRKLLELLAIYREIDGCFDEGDVYASRLPTSKDGRPVHVLSFDEKPGIQVLTDLAPKLMPNAAMANGGKSLYASVCQDYEYRRHGTVSLLAAIDLLDGRAFAKVRQSHKSSDFVDFLGMLDAFYPEGDVIRLILDNHSVHMSQETQLYLNTVPGRFEFVFPPTHASWTNMIEGFFSTMTKQLLGGIRCGTKDELREKIMSYIERFNAGEHRPRRWKWAIDDGRFDIDSVDPSEVPFQVVNGNTCRECDSELKAARPKTMRKPRPKRSSRKTKKKEPEWVQLELPLVWDDPVTLDGDKEAA